MENETGVCKTADKAVVASFAPHFGEEPPLVGTHGSGTIFFSHCSLRCCFCQNCDISLDGDGQAAEPGHIAAVMLELKKRGCHNINLVTPTHVVPQFLAALDIAADHGLDLPVVYNCGGYDQTETLALLDGVIDIYMPDFKFWDTDIARQACQAPDYPQIARQAVREMHRQVGDLMVDDAGIARSGLLVRHLVLPDDLAGTREVVAFLKDLSGETSINIMSQYRPMGAADQVPALMRPCTPAEFRQALKTALDAGLNVIR